MHNQRIHLKIKEKCDIWQNYVFLVFKSQPQPGAPDMDKEPSLSAPQWWSPRHHWRGEWGWRSGYTASPWDGVETFLGKSEFEYSVFFGLRAWTLPRLFWVQGILLSSHVLIIASTIQQSVQLIPLLSFHAPCANEVNVYFYNFCWCWTGKNSQSSIFTSCHILVKSNVMWRCWQADLDVSRIYTVFEFCSCWVRPIITPMKNGAGQAQTHSLLFLQVVIS